VGVYGPGGAGGVERHEGPDRDIDYFKLRPLIEKVIGTDTRWTADDIILSLIHGRRQVFVDEYGIVITEILQTRDRRLLVFLLSGEKTHLWKERMTKRLTDFARSQGCILVEAWCRQGLEGMLKDAGWKKEEVVLRIRL
jgi:hypothetical protein